MKRTTAKYPKVRSRQGVLVLECLDKTDPGSEGRFLSHMFDLMEDVDSQYVEVRSPAQLLAMMETSPFDTIHVTTHGHSEQGEFRGFYTPGGRAKLETFPANLLARKVLVSTACLSGQAEFRDQILGRLGMSCYIAPEGSPTFANAIYFAHIYYHNTFVLHHSSGKAVGRYTRRYKNPHGFGIFKPT